MAQISRPFQILCVVFALFAAVWFVALRGHSGATSGSSSSTAATASVPATPVHATVHAPKAIVHAPKAARGNTVQHGRLPRAATHAHAVAVTHHPATVEQRIARVAKELATSVKPSAVPSIAKSKAAPPAPTTGAKSATTTGAKSATLSQEPQRAVETVLKSGAIAVVLFWNPLGADDRVDFNQVAALSLLHLEALGSKRSTIARADKSLGLELNKPVAVFFASASEVADYGSITRGVQIYGTPTVLIVNPKGQATTLTGLTEVLAIEQAISELRHS